MPAVRSGRYVVGFEEIGAGDVALVGGKGRGLAELARIDGISVPAGFCVTTGAFLRTVAGAPPMRDLLDRLSRLGPDDLDATRTLSTEIRRTIEGIAIPADVEAAIADAVDRLGAGTACAVRSSATAEDLPAASFAGQHDTYLDIVGTSAVLRHVSRCWASLFTERAVIYRRHNGIDHRVVRMAVIVQEMAVSQAAGVLFTADPVTSNRTVAAVEAVPGLGEALVSGQVAPDSYRVRNGEIIARTIAVEPVLSDAQVVRLVEAGRRIEAHFGVPQDIEWCLAGDDLRFVQSRPITTLFPIPARDDGERHVYVSVGHQQMMTDAMRPLGYSVFQLTAGPPMYEAGGRLFVDVTPRLASAGGRAALLEAFGRGDPLLVDAMRTILDRADVVPPALADVEVAPPPGAGPPVGLDADPAMLPQLIEETETSLAALRRDIRTKSGPALFELILADIQEMKRLLFDPRTHRAIMAGMEATWWLNDQLQEWLGETNAADALTQSVPDNITSDMGLALLDVADTIRPHREVVDYLQHAHDDIFLGNLDELPGGRAAREAIESWLDRYGMRCVGEIDITRPRWSERPSMLVPVILGNIRNFEPGAAARRMEAGRHAAQEKERELLQRLRALPGGEQKAQQTKRMIDLLRSFTGYREYPKYGIVARYFIYKQALLDEAASLVRAQVIRDRDDVFYLTFQELHDAVRTGRVDDRLIEQRRETHWANQALTPPRVLTSDGEVFMGRYRRDHLPAGALAGLAVSGGTVEGRARVVLEMGETELGPGDILVTTHTDPSWTPVFVAVAGLVTEVGGSMTHGAVIAREYGLPAVVGVEHATRLITDGQRIRVDGTQGYVEILPTT